MIAKWHICWSALVLSSLITLAYGCGSDDDDDDNSGGNTASLPVDSETPPTNATAMTSWLEEGSYLQWNCAYSTPV